MTGARSVSTRRGQETGTVIRDVDSSNICGVATVACRGVRARLRRLDIGCPSPFSTPADLGLKGGCPEPFQPQLRGRNGAGRTVPRALLSTLLGVVTAVGVRREVLRSFAGSR